MINWPQLIVDNPDGRLDVVGSGSAMRRSMDKATTEALRALAAEFGVRVPKSRRRA
ncbi:hypothetical protein [Lentzea guizhouensis]|uniref:hypothetical protein n=1 Tax=Lentzea guizhouensis TaxID=1586287 RepID=UPI0012B68397|nr:hypothetical protein [Lentzea guizhouensis]